MRRRTGLAVGVATALTTLLAGAAVGAPTARAAPSSPPPAPATAAPYAPPDRPGPPLAEPASTLVAALSCTPGVTGATRNPVLLVAGTTLTPQDNYAWNYERAFSQIGWPYCTITLPNHEMSDIQVGTEYVVSALRTVSAQSHRKVDVLGFSQGGMVPRWALRFWPDTRGLVDNLVGLDPSNHGTLDADAACTTTCAPAVWQQRSQAQFMSALNSYGETWPGINYTNVYSVTDEVVVPNLPAASSSSLTTGGGRIANIAVQSVCPNDPSEHLAMGSYDAVGYALAIDAFTHPGPASAGRISPTVCAMPFQPGVNPATFPADYARYLGTAGYYISTYPHTAAEPPLMPYVYR